MKVVAGNINIGTVSRTIQEYFRNVFRGMRSVLRSLSTSLPYLMNVKSGDLKKEVTEQYPDPVSSRSAEELPARSRGLLFNDIERCTGCKECAVVCPVNCITVESELGANPNKVWVSVFDIDFSKCIFCGLCTEVCQPSSLTHTRKFERSVYSTKDLVAGFGRGRVTPEQSARWAAMRKAKESDEEIKT